MRLGYKGGVSASQIGSFVRQMVRRPSLGLVENLLGRAPWRRLPNERPWTDEEGALERIAAGRRKGSFDSELAGQLESWVRDGYVVVDGAIESGDLDEFSAGLDGLWSAALPRPGLKLYDLRESVEGPVRTLTHAQVLALPAAERQRMREASAWRTHGFHRYNLAGLRIYRNRRLRRLASAIFGCAARPFASISFLYGSRQALHQDMAVFHIYPHNFLIGAWVACEDIDPSSGPLVFLPGSHRAPPFPGFTDYPQTNLRTVDAERNAEYYRYIEGLAARYPRREFLAKRGQVLLWHGMLVHGGAPVTEPSRTRRSFVVHYHARHADRANQVLGPFNWT